MEKKIDYFPSAYHDQINLKPVYKKFDGWLKTTEGTKNWNDLPENAKKYISFVQEFCNTKISIVSTSPKRNDSILIEDPFNSN